MHVFFCISTMTDMRYYVTWVRLLGTILRRMMPFPSRERTQAKMSPVWMMSGDFGAPVVACQVTCGSFHPSDMPQNG